MFHFMVLFFFLFSRRNQRIRKGVIWSQDIFFKHFKPTVVTVKSARVWGCVLVLLHEIIWVFPAVKKMAPLYAWSALGANLFSFRWGFAWICHDLCKKSAIAGEPSTICWLNCTKACLSQDLWHSRWDNVRYTCEHSDMFMGPLNTPR